MHQHPREAPSKKAPALETILGFIVMVAFIALYFAVLTSPFLVLIVSMAIVLFTLGVIPLPRTKEDKFRAARELAQRIEDLQRHYPKAMHVDWPHSQAEWCTTRTWVIEERALKELKAERRANAEFPWSLPWWGRVLCCVPWLISGIFFFGDRLWGWPIWR